MRRFFAVRASSRAGLFASSCLCLALSGGSAAAQPASQRSSSQWSLQREEAGGADARAARARARAGDCAAALPSFDAAIRTTIEPTLRRDRGLCHDKLDHPYPAIDDYRAYLTARPDAPDAEQVRERLAVLEEATGQGGGAAGAEEDDDRPSRGRGRASATLSFGEDGARADASAGGSPSEAGAGEAEEDQDFDVATERERRADAAESSPLREGTGVVLGPFLHMPRVFLGEGAHDALAYGVGAAIRYATSRNVSVITELGYAGIGVSGAQSSSAGPLLMGGVELRLPVSRYATDQILLRGGLGFERYVVSGTRAGTNDLIGRFGAGYRRVFGPSLGLEAVVDGGPVYAMPEGGDGRVNFVVGGSVAILVGF